MNVTPEEVQAEVEKRGITYWSLRNCSICGSPIGYLFERGEVGFDSNCDCTPYRSPIQLRDYHDVACQFNMQTHPGIAEKMWRDFLNNSEQTADRRIETKEL